MRPSHARSYAELAFVALVLSLAACGAPEGHDDQLQPTDDATSKTSAVTATSPRLNGADGVRLKRTDRVGGQTGPILVWPFDGTDATIVDASGLGNDGRVPKPLRMRGGAAANGGGMLLVDGSLGSTPASAPLDLGDGDGFGFALWLRLRRSDQIRVLEYTDADGALEAAVDIDRENGVATLKWSVRDATLEVRSTIDDGTWHHIAGSWSKNAATMTFWVDGEQLGAADIAHEDRGLSSAGTVRLAAETAGARYSLASAACAAAGTCTETRRGARGALDDFALFARPVDDGDVSRMFRSGRSEADECAGHFGTWSCPATSCQEVVRTHSGWGDGVYWLKSTDVARVRSVCGMRDGGIEGRLLVLPATEDAHVDSWFPDTVHPREDLRVVGGGGPNGLQQTAGTAPQPARRGIAYLKFDLSDVGAGEVVSARLELTPFSGADAQESATARVHRASADWDDATLNWHNRPQIEPGFVGEWNRSLDAHDGSHRVSLTTAALRGLVQTSATQETLSVALEASERDFLVYSRDSAPEGDEPTLIVAVLP